MSELPRDPDQAGRIGKRTWEIDDSDAELDLDNDSQPGRAADGFADGTDDDADAVSDRDDTDEDAALPTSYGHPRREPEDTEQDDDPVADAPVRPGRSAGSPVSAPRPSGSPVSAPRPTRTQLPASTPTGTPQPATGPAPRPQQGTRPQPRVNPEQTPGVRPPQPTEHSAPLPEEQAQGEVSAGDLIQRLATNDDGAKATHGWRKAFGLGPSAKERDEMRDLADAKTVFSRPVTIMIANPKGGAGKTPTSLLLAAAFGLARGGGVVAWDNNELRGTMPDRSESIHRRNVRDLLANIDELRQPYSQFTDLAQFLNHQSQGTFYTLGSASNSIEVVSKTDFELIHDIFSRYFQVIVVDTGNNEAAPNWLAAARVADCLVVPTKWRKDSLIPAARMLETLQTVNPGLLERTVIAATNGPADSRAEVKANGAGWFGSSHPIVEIPVDPHIADGGVIKHSGLKPATQRAALRLAAEVSRRLIQVASKE